MPASVFRLRQRLKIDRVLVYVDVRVIGHEAEPPEVFAALINLDAGQLPDVLIHCAETSRVLCRHQQGRETPLSTQYRMVKETANTDGELVLSCSRTVSNSALARPDRRTAGRSVSGACQPRAVHDWKTDRTT